MDKYNFSGVRYLPSKEYYDELKENGETQIGGDTVEYDEKFLYVVPETPEELAAANSGITAELVEQIGKNENDIDNLQEDIEGLQEDKQDKLTFDTVPTEGSSNPVTSAGIRTAILNALLDYYTKTETYNKSEVDTLVAAIKTIHYTIVSTLPIATAETYFNVSKTVYLISNTSPGGNDYFDEYITVRSGVEGAYTYSWEKIGNTQIDLSNYYTKTETDNLFTFYYTKTAIDLLLAAKQDLLISGKNIKTIDGQSILGSGDLRLSLFSTVTGEFINSLY